MFYRIALGAHSWNRWIILLVGVILIVLAWKHWIGRTENRQDVKRMSIWFIIAIDIQLLLGISLYVVSPIIEGFFLDPEASFSQTPIRFWAIEHATIMLLATALAHVGRVMFKKAGDAVTANRRAAIAFTISYLLILAGIPWPFLDWGRPLFFS